MRILYLSCYLGVPVPRALTSATALITEGMANNNDDDDDNNSSNSSNKNNNNNNCNYNSSASSGHNMPPWRPPLEAQSIIESFICTQVCKMSATTSQCLRTTCTLWGLSSRATCPCSAVWTAPLICLILRCSIAHPNLTTKQARNCFELSYPPPRDEYKARVTHKVFIPVQIFCICILSLLP